MTQVLQVRPLSPAAGVEVTGLDPGRDISPAGAARLRQLLNEHQLLVFRALQLSAADQVRLLSLFGPVSDEGEDGSHHTFVSNERADGGLAERNLPFHA